MTHQAIQRAAAALAALVLVAAAVAADSTEQASRAYYAYVCAESDDTIALVRFSPESPGRGRLEVVKTIPVGIWPTEIEGPHGIAVHPDGRSWYVSLSHGNPYGSVHKFATGTDEFLASVEVGLFPATMDISASTGFLHVVNFNLYGRMEPSSVSIVDTLTMSEIARVPSGIMPHGSRMNAAGTRQYHVSMMDDRLHEVDGLSFAPSRTLALSEHGEHMVMMDMTSEAGAEMMKRMRADLVQPTWATQPTDAGKLYVAGNNSSTIYEVDVETFTITRRFEHTTNGPYNLDVTRDGRWLVATYKKSAAIGIWDLTDGREVANLRTTRTVPHGVVISSDQRYAFVTNEGVGGEPGTVEVYDLGTLTRAAAVDVGKQAGGIAFWKVE